jgi:steroid 5-alpha reductase family enzyme
MKNFNGSWTVVGLISMILLFYFISVPMMEKRNITRKPDYRDYINQVPALFPSLKRKKPELNR